MSQFWNLARAEVLKLKQSYALWIVGLAPLLASSLYFLVLLRNRPKPMPHPWMAYGHSVVQLWSFLALPMLVTVLTLLVNGTEHQHSLWKHLFVQPLAKWKVLLVKQCMTLGLLALATLGLIPSIAILGTVLGWLRPTLGFQESIPWGALFLLFLRPWLAAWCMLAIHQWVSTRWGSMAVSLGLGFGGLVGAFVIVNSKEWGRFYPWCLALRASASNHFVMETYVGILGGLAIWAWALWDGQRREFA